jgi:AmiR/NasT family two-component response regulator
MRLRDDVVGALNLFGSAPGLDVGDTRVAQALADVATIGLLQHRAQHRADTVTQQLQAALDSRVLIEQAKGILAERLDVDMDRAFALLRGRARARQQHLSDLAGHVVAGTEMVMPSDLHKD